MGKPERGPIEALRFTPSSRLLLNLNKSNILYLSIEKRPGVLQSNGMPPTPTPSSGGFRFVDSLRSAAFLGATFLALTATAAEETPLDPQLQGAVEHASRRSGYLAQNVLRNDDERFVNYTTASGTWRTQNDSSWTCGFVPGVFWYLRDLTSRPGWEGLARHWDSGVRSRATATDNDTGFQIFTPYVLALDFGQTINAADYESVIHIAAETLTDQRWNATIGCYRAWPAGDKTPTSMPFEVNIDMMMNMELILWSGQNGGPSEYVDHAISHADISWRDLVREDGSTFHVVEYNSSGEVVSKRTHQGWKRDSTWSRGQAWAVYGFAMLYRYTELPRMLERAEKCFDYFVAATDAQTDDAIPYSDFDAPLDSQNPHDSSAAAIVASAALELWASTGEQRFLDRAEHILRSLSAPPYLTTEKSHQAILDLASEKWGEPDVGAIFADFYFLEAIWRYWAWTPAEYGDWYGFPERSGHLVRTGGWLGTIEVGEAPWILLRDYPTWGYLYEPSVTDHGAWVYHPRLSE